MRIVRFTVFQRRGSDGGGAGRSVGLFRASLHAYGGTFDSVTCHQRRYHYAHLRIVAGSRAVGCNQRSVSRSTLTYWPPGRLASWRTRCLASRKQNVSACPIRFNTILLQTSGKVDLFRSRKYGMRATAPDKAQYFSTEIPFTRNGLLPIVFASIC